MSVARTLKKELREYGTVEGPYESDDGVKLSLTIRTGSRGQIKRTVSAEEENEVAALRKLLGSAEKAYQEELGIVRNQYKKCGLTQNGTPK